jgi:hypothetical protein
MHALSKDYQRKMYQQDRFLDANIYNGAYAYLDRGIFICDQKPDTRHFRDMFWFTNARGF